MEFFRQHFDLTSPSVGGCTGEVFPCPLCAKVFNSAPDLELHVNIEHRDVLSPASPSSSKYSCPVCGLVLDSDSNVSLHIQILIFSHLCVINSRETCINLLQLTSHLNYAPCIFPERVSC